MIKRKESSHTFRGRASIFNLQLSIFIFLLLALPVHSAVGPGTTIETMDGTIGTWDTIDWVPTSLTAETTTLNPPLPDSIRFLPDGQLSVDEVYIGGVVHLQMDNVPTDGYLRLDASTHQQVFNSNLEHWGMCVALFFDEQNWVTMTRIRETGGGYMSIRRVAGAESKHHMAVGYGADNAWRMHGIELTSSNINFHATPLTGPDTFSSNNWDELMSLDLSAHSFARPPSYAGDVTLIVGKGYAGGPGSDPWNGTWDLIDPKVVSIDATRVIVGDAVVQEVTPIIDFEVTGTTAFVSFATETGATYHLESTTGLVASAWADTGAFVDGNGGTNVLTDDVGATVGDNYRVAFGAPDLGIHFIPLWDIDPYENFKRDRAPGPGTPPLQPIEVQMAQGEYRDALFMVGPPESGEVTVNVQVDTFGGLPPGMILVQETLYVRNLTLNQPDTFTGDAVYPLTGPLVVPAGESRQVRLRFDARYSGVQPGVYPFHVTVSDAGSSDQVIIPGTVEVWDFDLPSIEETPSHNWVQIKATSWSGQVLDNGIQEMKKYGPNYIYVSHTELPAATIVDASGNILSMNYSSFDYRVSAPLNAWQAGAGNEALKYIFYLLDLSLGQTDDGQGSIITYPSPEWNTLFADWISRMRNRLLSTYGVGNERWMMVLGDEVGEQTLMDYTIPLAETIKSIDATVTLNSNSSVILAEPWASRYYAAFDIFQPNLQHLEANSAILTFLEASGKTLWGYKAAGFCGSVGFDVYRYYRSFGWRAIRYGMEGIGLWTYCANQGGAPQYDWPGYNPGGIQTSLGHILVWQHWANNDIVHCRRYEMYRETLDDMRYIRKLREVAAAAGAQAQADAEALIDQATIDIVNQNADHTRCDFWRKQIAAEILALQ